MNISASWSREISLKDGSKKNAIFLVEDEELPEEAGCYVFFNQFGNSRKIIYIGRANNIRARLRGQFNNLKLMIGIRNAGRGNKKLICCTVNPKSGQKQDKIIGILEKNLIKHAFTEGHELLNIQGAKIHFHEISFTGNRISESLFNRNILSPIR